MAIDLLEKTTFVLAGLTVLGVASGVALVSYMPGGLRSGISRDVIDAQMATAEWLEQQRKRSGVRTAQVEQDYVAPPVRATSGGAPATPQQRQQAAAKLAKKMPELYFVEDEGAIPPAEQVPGIPWVRQVPGVVYKPPQAVPEILYRKYQSFEDTMALVQEGGGEFVETDAGTAYQVNWVNEASLLHSKIGLRPGDKVIAVNGQPIGKSLGAGKAMFEQMKNERRFAVLIERKGRKMVLSYTVR